MATGTKVIHFPDCNAGSQLQSCCPFVRTGWLVYLTWTTLFVSAGISNHERGSTRWQTSSEEDPLRSWATLGQTKQCWLCCFEIKSRSNKYLSIRCKSSSADRRSRTSIEVLDDMSVMYRRSACEHRTSRLSGVRSNHLSYRPGFGFDAVKTKPVRKANCKANRGALSS